MAEQHASTANILTGERHARLAARLLHAPVALVWERSAQQLHLVGAHGLSGAELRAPDEDDPLGGVLEIWQHDDEDELPLDPVEVVNFCNPYRPGRNPGTAAVRNARRIEEGSNLRYVQLPDLIVLKLYTGARRDQADVVELLARNPETDRDAIRVACEPFGLTDLLELLFREADQMREADR